MGMIRSIRRPIESATAFGCEVLLYSLALVVLGQSLNLAFRLAGFETLSFREPTLVQAAVEELCFRWLPFVILIPIGRALGQSRSCSIALVLVASSIGFSLAHGNQNAFAFTFRLFAGCAFSGIYLCRGLHYAIVTHWTYNTIAMLLLRVV